MWLQLNEMKSTYLASTSFKHVASWQRLLSKPLGYLQHGTVPLQTSYCPLDWHISWLKLSKWMNLWSPGTPLGWHEWTVYSMPATPSPPHTSNGCAEWTHRSRLDNELFRFLTGDLRGLKVGCLFNHWVPILLSVSGFKLLVFLNLCNQKSDHQID